MSRTPLLLGEIAIGAIFAKIALDRFNQADVLLETPAALRLPAQQAQQMGLARESLFYGAIALGLFGTAAVTALRR